MPARPRVKYPGDLGKPMQPLAKSFHSATESLDEAAERMRREYCRRLLLLMDHYQISPDDPDYVFRLMLALASDNVDGLRVRTGRLAWTAEDDLALYVDVQKKRKHNKHGARRSQILSVEDACKSLKKSGRWPGKSASEMERHFVDIRPDMRAITNRYLAQKRSGEPIEQIQAIVEDWRGKPVRPRSSAELKQIINELRGNDS